MAAHLNTGYRGNAGEGWRLCGEGAIEGVGKELPALVGQSTHAADPFSLPEEQEPLRLGDGEGAKQNGVEQGEDGGVGADAEGEREQGNQCETWSLDELSEGEA